MQKREKRPFFGLFEMQFTLFPILHFVNPLKSDTNTGTLVSYIVKKFFINTYLIYKFLSEFIGFFCH